MRNLKRALSLALASIMVLGMMVVGAGAVSIDDFSDGEKIVHKEAVTVLTQLNVINGKEDNSYDPEGIITRAEMAKLICVVLNGGKDPNLGTVATYTYSDTVGHWAAGYIEYCTKLGIIAGDGKGNFNPNNTVTGSEASKMLLAAIGYQPTIEGFVGANWAVATNVQANKIGLYDYLEINPDNGLTRDSAAQMVFNALSAYVVTYKYTLTTDGSTVSSIPELVETNSAGDKVTVLQDKFKASKVEAVVVSNEHAALSNPYSAADDKGETTLDVISIDGSKTNARTGTYKVSTDKDLLGQNVMVYIKYKNTAGYDEDEAIVIGQPIVTSKNKVATSNDGTKLADILDDNNLDTDSDTRFYVNYGGYYGGLVYGKDRASTEAVPVGDKDNTLTTMTAAEFDYAAKTVGVSVRLIDNNNDKVVDYALAEKYSYGMVNKYTTGSDGAVRVQGLFNEDEYDYDDVVGADAVSAGDLVLFTEYGGKLYVEQAETVEAKLDNYSTSKKNVTLDGETIKWSGLNGNVLSEQEWIGTYVTSSGVLNTSATYHKDVNGYVFAVSETDESLLNYAVLLGFENQTAAISGNLGKTARAKLLLSDGTVSTYDVATIGGKAVTNCSAGGYPTSTEVGFTKIDQYNIYSYSKTDSGAMRLVKRTEVNDTSSQSTANGGDNTITNNVQFVKGSSRLNVTGGNYTVSDRTIFLYGKTDGSTARYVGRTAPGINEAGAAATQISVRANSRGEALVVFLNNLNPSADFSDNFIYVYDTRVSQNGDSYEVKGILDGKIDTYMVEMAYGANNTTEVLLPDRNAVSGVYQHTIELGLYNYSEDDGIYTLTKYHVTGGSCASPAAGSNDTNGIVDAIRSDYIRVAGASYTVTDKTLFFEARKNKTALENAAVNAGDQVTVVYDDDGKAVYVFLTEYSYNLVASGAAITSATATATAVNTNGGTAATVTTNAVSPDNRTYQWYDSTGIALVEGVDFTGTKTSTLVAKSGIAAGTYNIYCTVSNKDNNGVVSSMDSNALNVTVEGTATSGTTLSYSDNSTYTVYADDSQVALTWAAGRNGYAVVIPEGTARVAIQHSSWTVGDKYSYNGKIYTVDGDKCVSISVNDVGATIGTFVKQAAVTGTVEDISNISSKSDLTDGTAVVGNGSALKDLVNDSTITAINNQNILMPFTFASDETDGVQLVIKNGSGTVVYTESAVAMTAAGQHMFYIDITAVENNTSGTLSGAWSTGAAPAGSYTWEIQTLAAGNAVITGCSGSFTIA